MTAKIALTERDMQAAFSLRYKAYIEAGYLEKIEIHRFSDIYDTRPSSKTILIYRGAVPVGSVRVCQLDRALPEPFDIPASFIFHEEINSLLMEADHGDRPAKAVEITRLARDPAFFDDRQISLAMFRMVGYVILAEQADIVFAAVTPNHTPFYRRMGYQKVGEAKDYPGLDVKTCLMACFRQDYGAVQQQVSILSDISRDDDTFAAFMSGQPVPVFGRNPPPPSTVHAAEARPASASATR